VKKELRDGEGGLEPKAAGCRVTERARKVEALPASVEEEKHDRLVLLHAKAGA
jgi:hypothetical protein